MKLLHNSLWAFKPAFIRRQWQWFLDAAIPRFCMECQGRLRGFTPWRYFCELCAEKGFVRIEGPACDHCGAAFYGEVHGSRICPKCIELVPVFGAGKALLQFDGLGRSLVHALKYREGRFLLPDITRCAQLSSSFREFLAGAILVPVPLYPSKWRARGYNQSECIAKAWAKITPDVRVVNALTRCRPTASQTGLSRAERFENVKNAFAIRRKTVLIPEQKYILVDDVYTTGATLQACAGTLASAGAQVIHVATLCHG